MNFLYFILFGACVGWLAGQLTKGSGFGVVGNIIIGVIGAILGGFVFQLIGFSPVNLLGQLIAATVGSILLLFLLGILQKSRR